MSARILVVDDDRSVRESLRIALRTEGFDVVTADDGESALEEVAKQTFDGVVIDLMMPGMNGLAVIRVLRARLPHLPVILMSGSITGRSEREALQELAGALEGISALAKPFRLADILDLANRRFREPVRN